VKIFVTGHACGTEVVPLPPHYESAVIEKFTRLHLALDLAILGLPLTFSNDESPIKKMPRVGH